MTTAQKMKRLKAAIKSGKPIVAAFPPKTLLLQLKFPKSAKVITADCGHKVITGQEQRQLRDEGAPLCCVICMFLVGGTVDQVVGLGDVQFRMHIGMVNALTASRAK